ncbi:MAG: sulfur carrier protein ThiS [Baekduia sp.]
MTLVVNGERSAVEPPVTVADLLVAIAAPERGVAVAVDGAVVPRSEWAAHTLAGGEQVEVLTAVQGG